MIAFIVIGIIVLAGGGASLYFFWLKPKWDKEKKDKEKREKEKKEAEAAAAAAAAAAATTVNENENQPGDIVETIVTSAQTGGTPSVTVFNFSAWKRRRQSLGWDGSVDKIDDLIQKITEAKNKGAEISADKLPKKFFDRALTFLKTDLKKEAMYVKNFKFGEWKKSRRAALDKQNAKIDNLIKDIQEAKKNKKDRLGPLPYKYYDEAIPFLKTLKKK